MRSGSGTGKWELSIVQIRVLLLQLCDKPSNTVAKGQPVGTGSALLLASLFTISHHAKKLLSIAQAAGTNADGRKEGRQL